MSLTHWSSPDERIVSLFLRSFVPAIFHLHWNARQVFRIHQLDDSMFMNKWCEDANTLTDEYLRRLKFIDQQDRVKVWSEWTLSFCIHWDIFDHQVASLSEFHHQFFSFSTSPTPAKETIYDEVSRSLSADTWTMIAQDYRTDEFLPVHSIKYWRTNSGEKQSVARCIFNAELSEKKPFLTQTWNSTESAKLGWGQSGLITK